MLVRVSRLMAVTVMLAAAWLATTPAHALDSIDLSVSGDAALAGPNSSRGQAADDDDEDTFFSSISRKRNRITTGTIASAGPAPAAAARPMVDVAATCQAVLADNLNYYNFKFIEGCKRVVASRSRR